MLSKFSRILRISAAVLCLLASNPFAMVSGQCVEDELPVFGINPGDRVGRSVAVTGGRVFVGAIGDDGGGLTSGSVRSFKRTASSYQLEHVFNGQTGAEYGSAIAADENWLAIGAAGQGYIEMWKRDRFGWSLQTTIVDFSGHDGDGFGSSLSLCKGVLAVGSPTYMTDVGDSGCVTIWRRTQMGAWVLEERLIVSDRVEGDDFGTAVSLDPFGQLLVGAPGRDVNGIDSGIALLYSGGPDGWAESQRFGSSVVNPGDRFGTSVSLRTSHAVIGSPYSNFAGPLAGKVVSYRRSAGIWILLPFLTPPAGSVGTGYGATLAIEDDLLVVGAPMDTGNEAVPTGSVNIYRYENGWQLESSHQGTPGSFLGTAVALDKGVVIAGAPLDSASAPLGGAVSFIVSGDDDCDSNGEFDSCEIFSGASQDCDLDGIPDQCAISAGLVADCDGDLIPDSCSTISGGVADCDADGVPDSCSTALGLVSDCDENQVPDVCQEDCNQNGEPDVCDVLNLDADCDQNGSVDECEIAVGSISDCDGNGLPDVCEPDCDDDGLPDVCAVLSGIVEDCNGNLNPDECDLDNLELNVNGNEYVDECEPTFVRGDADGEQGVRLADAILLLSRVFGEDSIPNCDEAADVNADGFLDITDGIYLLLYEFANGAAPPAPFPDCGIAPLDAAFPCSEHPTCP